MSLVLPTWLRSHTQHRSKERLSSLIFKMQKCRYVAFLLKTIPVIFNKSIDQNLAYKSSNQFKPDAIQTTYNTSNCFQKFLVPYYIILNCTTRCLHWRESWLFFTLSKLHNGSFIAPSISIFRIEQTEYVARCTCWDATILVSNPIFHILATIMLMIITGRCNVNWATMQLSLVGYISNWTDVIRYTELRKVFARIWGTMSRDAEATRFYLRYLQTIWI
jgi:hypothetical protein